jgi:hypothetical protein
MAIAAGNVLTTDAEHPSVMRWEVSTHRLTTLLRSPKIRWADALSYGPEGWLYIRT